MRKSMWLGAAMFAALCLQPVQAGEGGEFQISTFVGEQRLRIDGDQLLDGETVRFDAFWTGLSGSYRLPSGLLMEAAYGYSAHDGVFSFTVDDDVELYHYSAAVGWQFDLGRWRLTPKLGLARSKLNSEARLLLNDNGGRTDKIYNTIPYAEASFVYRLGEHWSIGATLRDAQEDFGHTRSWGALFQFNFN